MQATDEGFLMLDVVPIRYTRSLPELFAVTLLNLQMLHHATQVLIVEDAHDV